MLTRRNSDKSSLVSAVVRRYAVIAGVCVLSSGLMSGCTAISRTAWAVNEVIHEGPHQPISDQQVIDNINMLRTKGYIGDTIAQYYKIMPQIADDITHHLPNLTWKWDTRPDTAHMIDGGLPDDPTHRTPTAYYSSRSIYFTPNSLKTDEEFKAYWDQHFPLANQIVAHYAQQLGASVPHTIAPQVKDSFYPNSKGDGFDIGAVLDAELYFRTGIYLRPDVYKGVTSVQQSLSSDPRYMWKIDIWQGLNH